MTVYDAERDYITDQLSSYWKAKKELKKIIENSLENSRPDYRGDDEKIMSALQSSIEYIDNERREFYNQNKHHMIEFQKAKIFRGDISRKLDALYPQTRLWRAVIWGLRGDRENKKETQGSHYGAETEIIKTYLMALGAINPNITNYDSNIKNYDLDIVEHWRLDDLVRNVDAFIEIFVDNAGTLEFDDLSYFDPYSQYSEFLSVDTFKRLKIFNKTHLYKKYRPPFTVFNDENGHRVADLRRVDARDRIYEGQEYRVILRDTAENLYGKDVCQEKGIDLKSGAEIGGIVFRATKLEERGVRFTNTDGWSDYNKLDNEIFARWHSLIKIIET